MLSGPDWPNKVICGKQFVTNGIVVFVWTFLTRHHDKKRFLVLIVSQHMFLYILSLLVLIFAPVVSLAALYCNLSNVMICFFDRKGPKTGSTWAYTL